jgi:hypothetical protein
VRVMALFQCLVRTPCGLFQRNPLGVRLDSIRLNQWFKGNNQRAFNGCRQRTRIFVARLIIAHHGNGCRRVVKAMPETNQLRGGGKLHHDWDFHPPGYSRLSRRHNVNRVTTRERGLFFGQDLTKTRQQQRDRSDAISCNVRNAWCILRGCQLATAPEANLPCPITQQTSASYKA